MLDKVTGKTDERRANNPCVFDHFLSDLQPRINELASEAFMRAQGYERKTPYSRWENVRK